MSLMKSCYLSAGIINSVTSAINRTGVLSSNGHALLQMVCPWVGAQPIWGSKCAGPQDGGPACAASCMGLPLACAELRSTRGLLPVMAWGELCSSGVGCVNAILFEHFLLWVEELSVVVFKQ
jgi:hypothetical protein